jgi:CBS domain-containing protein
MTVKLEDAGLDRFKRISEIANMNPVYCEGDLSISDVVGKMMESNYRRMPIISKSKEIIGIVTTSDILDAFLKKTDFDEKVSTIMIRDVIFCEVGDTLDFILQKFKLSRRGGFPIVDDDKLVGVVSERDFVKKFSEVNFSIKVEEGMTKKPFFIQSSISISDCLKTIVNTRYRRLPIVDKGNLVGITTVADLIRYMHEKKYDQSSMDEPIDPIIIKDIYTISKDNDLSDVIKRMREKDVGGLLIVDNDKLEGIITERDILEEIV